jgi:hypothetical protein
MFVDFYQSQPASASSSPHHLRAMAAIDSAVSGEDVEVVLARLQARLDGEDAQRRATEAKAERMQARVRDRPASVEPIAAAPKSPPVPVLPAGRGAAIDALVLPGTEFLAPSLKADTSITIEAASQRIIAEYKRQKGFGATYSSGAAARARTVPQTAEGWKAEWHGSKELQRDHGSAAAYANYMQGVADGRARVYQPGAGVIRGEEIRRAR